MQELIELDAEWSRRLRVAEKPGALRTLAAVMAHSGDSWFWLIGLVILWMVGNEVWRWRALVLAISIVVMAVVVMAIKFTIRRRRPEGEWGAIYRNTDPHSFPSGHAVRAVMLAVLVISLGPIWMGVLLVIWAPLVGLARVAMGVHYLSDVLAGMVFGLVIGGVLGAVFW